MQEGQKPIEIDPNQITCMTNVKTLPAAGFLPPSPNSLSPSRDHNQNSITFFFCRVCDMYSTSTSRSIRVAKSFAHMSGITQHAWPTVCSFACGWNGPAHLHWLQWIMHHFFSTHGTSWLTSGGWSFLSLRFREDSALCKHSVTMNRGKGCQLKVGDLRRGARASTTARASRFKTMLGDWWHRAEHASEWSSHAGRSTALQRNMRGHENWSPHAPLLLDNIEWSNACLSVFSCHKGCAEDPVRPSHSIWFALGACFCTGFGARDALLCTLELQTCLTTL